MRFWQSLMQNRHIETYTIFDQKSSFLRYINYIFDWSILAVQICLIFLIAKTSKIVHFKDRLKCTPLVLTFETGVLQLDCQSAGRTRKINLPTNQKGCDNSETSVEKLSTRRTQISPVYFSVIIFDLLNFKTSESMAPTKIDRNARSS